MMELYGGGVSRWVKCYWALKEIGQEFNEYSFNFSKGEHKSPQVLALNPFGKLPVLKDGDRIVFESSAILNYLGEKFPESELVPKSGTPERTEYDQWTYFCVSVLESPLWQITQHTRLVPEHLRIPQLVELAKAEFKQLAKTLDKWIESRSYLVGDRFSGADIALVYDLNWAGGLGLLKDFVNLQDYRKELSERPAFPKHLYARN